MQLANVMAKAAVACDVTAQLRNSSATGTWISGILHATMLNIHCRGWSTLSLSRGIIKEAILRHNAEMNAASKPDSCISRDLKVGILDRSCNPDERSSGLREQMAAAAVAPIFVIGWDKMSSRIVVYVWVSMWVRFDEADRKEKPRFFWTRSRKKNNKTWRVEAWREDLVGQPQQERFANRYWNHSLRFWLFLEQVWTKETNGSFRWVALCGNCNVQIQALDV